MEHDPELCADVIAGGIDKYVKQQGRNTVMQNVEHDEALVGYARVAGPDACPFCKTMSSQGFHFKSRATAMSGAKGDVAGQFHAYCNCGLAVAFKDAKGKIRAEGLDGTSLENWDPDELYREYKEAGWKFGHNRKRENASRKAAKRWANGFSQTEQRTSGAVSGAIRGRDKRSLKRMQDHADRYYNMLRNSDEDYIVIKLSERTGLTQDEARQAFRHLFIEEHDLDIGRARFTPEYEISQSTQRILGDGELLEHDELLFPHELAESKYMSEGLSQSDAHDRANLSYNYQEATLRWLESLGFSEW